MHNFNNIVYLSVFYSKKTLLKHFNRFLPTRHLAFVYNVYSSSRTFNGARYSGDIAAAAVI